MPHRPPLSRRALLSGLGALGIGAGALVAAGDDDFDGSDWPMYRHDAAGTAHAPDASVPREQPTELWTHEFESLGFTTPAPILHDGRVFVARQSLTAFDVESGDRVFRIGSENNATEFLSTPAVASARAYVTPSLVAASEDGLRAVGIDGGPDLPVVDGGALSQRWSTGQQPDESILTSMGFGGGWQSPPVAAAERVFTVDDGIVAVEASSGSIQWRTTFDALAARPAVVDGRLFTVAYDGSLSEYAVADGTQRWTAPTPAVRQERQPTVANGSVYLAHETGVTAFDPDGGDERWTRGQPVGEYGRYVTPPSVTSDAVYAVGSGLLDDETDGLIALDAATGDRLWDASLSGISEDEDGPAVAGDVVLQPDNHSLRAFDAATGDPLWQIQRDAQVSQPAVGDGRFYLTDGRSITAYGGT
ncbi:PQQ-binding-like beta-propeller repeat protein [Halorientalis halophila]|uniref:PQQ-binding-like beta-propeller repeat protein n=1 Tax=Halorientalis halophila TaxID=3108499 RepID=UPI00300A55E0